MAAPAIALLVGGGGAFMPETRSPRPMLELSPDHFHPSFKRQARGRASAAAPKSSSLNPDAHSIALAKYTSSARKARAVVKDLLGGSQRAFVFVAANASRAARWSGRYSITLAEKAREILSPHEQPGSDTLVQLAEGGRYCAISNRLGALTQLTSEEETSVRHNTPNRRIHQAGSEIAIEGDAAPAPLFIASGWACRTRFARNGQRQIIGFVLPGDPIGLHAARMSLSHTSVISLTSVETVDASSVMEMATDPSTFPGVRNGIQRLHLQDEQFLVNQIARLANPSREERVAHLLLELHWRLQQARLATFNEFPMPLSDAEVGDALAIGPKAARNTLNSFRRRQIFRHRFGRAEILRRDHFLNIAGFYPPAPDACVSAPRVRGATELLQSQPATQVETGRFG